MSRSRARTCVLSLHASSRSARARLRPLSPPPQITGVVDPRGNKSGFNSSSPVRVTGSLTNVTLKGAALRCAFTAAPFVRSNAGLPLGPANSNSNSNTLKLTSPSLAFDLVLPCDVLSWGSVDACALAAASAPLAPADTLLVLPLGRKTVKFTPNGTLSLPVGPLVPFFGLTAEVTPGGVLSQLQAASLVTRVRSFLLKARPVAKLSGLARGNKAQTSLAVQLVNASFDAREERVHSLRFEVQGLGFGAECLRAVSRAQASLAARLVNTSFDAREAMQRARLAAFSAAAPSARPRARDGGSGSKGAHMCG